MAFKTTQKLQVGRILVTGQQVDVGVLAQNKQGVYFQYSADYLAQFGSLSPLALPAMSALQVAPKQPHGGIHGVFADSLPDAWGLLLQDRLFRQHGILPNQLTAMDRLAFVGAQGMGALVYSPVSEYNQGQQHTVSLDTLGLEAQALFDHATTESYNGPVEEVLAVLTAAGSSGGARPKAQVYMAQGDDKQWRTYTHPQRARPQDEAWLVKFTSSHLPLGHEEGVCEAVYLSMAEQAGLQPPAWKLLPAPASSGAAAWLAVKRFDYLANSPAPGRLHMHSACGLLNADFRTPSLDYIDLIKVSRHICQSPSIGRLQFSRAIFNLFGANQDDHSKNWSFLQSDSGSWQVAPFYDVTYSPHPFNEHATAFSGYGKQPSLKAMQKLAASAGFANWQEAQKAMHSSLEVLSQFSTISKDMEVSKAAIKGIQKTLNQRLEENRHLL